MQVFVSWSGERSRKIAEAIRNWLPKVIQSVRPWMSGEDIGAGVRWLTEVSTILNNAKVGLICVTSENQHNPWLLFEAGALSKTLEQTCVCPLVYEMTPGQIKGPLAQFQSNTLDRNGIGKVLSTINKCLGDDQRLEQQQLEEILDVWWPKLEEKLKTLPPASEPVAARSTSDQLEELLLLAREQIRRENIRLEASKERDEQIDSMLGYMDKIGMTVGSMQKNAQRIISQGLKADGNSLNGRDIPDSVRMFAESMATGNIDASFVSEMNNIARGMQEHEKTRRDDMLNPPIDGNLTE